MSTSVSVPTLNPTIQGTGEYSFLNQPMLSQYVESNNSIFGIPSFNGVTTGGTYVGGTSGLGISGGLGYGMYGMYGMNSDSMNQYIDAMKTYNNGMVEIQESANNASTKLFFNQQGNQYVQNSGDTQLQEQLARYKELIEANEMRAAASLYDTIYETVSKQVGQELDENSDRVDHKDSVKERIMQLYRQVNGTSMTADIKKNGDGETWAMIKSVFSGGQPSKKDMLSYVSSDKQQYDWWDSICRSLRGNGKADLEETTEY